MQPYDGVDYRFTSADSERDKALAVIERLLGFRPSETGLDYSLNFYSGGTGVDDRLAVRCRLESVEWPTVVSRLRLNTISEALSDASWSEDFEWLVRGDAPGHDIESDCLCFINSNKLEFQDAAVKGCELRFAGESNVNTWCVLWLVNGNLNYLSFDQG